MEQILNSVPDEVWGVIFSPIAIYPDLVCTFPLVCRRFRSLLRKSSAVWKYISRDVSLIRTLREPLR